MTQSPITSCPARRTAGMAALTAVFVAAAGMASAQDSISYDEKVEAFKKNVTLLGIPPATVAPDGLVFAALAWTDKRNGYFEDDPDGSMAFGFGVGVGDGLFDLQFTTHITSLEDDFGDSGFFDIRASKRIDNGGVPTYLGLGVGRIAPWGDAEGDDVSYSGSITAFPTVRLGGDVYPLMLTLGAGSDVRNFGVDSGVFAGLGIGLTETFGTSVAYNGENFDLGASFRIPGLDQVGFNVILNDAFDQDDRQRVILSVNWIAENVF